MSRPAPSFRSLPDSSPAGIRIALISLTCLLGLMGEAAAQQITGQWNFDGVLPFAAAVGSDLEYIDGPDGMTATGTAFGTTTALGISGIGGREGRVMFFPEMSSSSEGFRVRHGAEANGGGVRVNQYTLIMDYFPLASSSGKWRALWQTSSDNGDLADLNIDNSGRLEAGAFPHGLIEPGTWHRIAFVVDQSAAVDQLSKFIDGQLVGSQSGDGTDGTWSLSPASDPSTPWSLLFTSVLGAAETDPGYVSSIQFRDYALSPAEVSALGGPTAEGIPWVAPVFSTTALPVRTAPDDLATGDLNGDGLDDLVAVHPGEDRVSISLADGSGGFAPPTYHGTEPSPVAVELGDVDADGRLDVVVVGSAAAGLSKSKSAPAGGEAAANGWISVLGGDGVGGLTAPSTSTAGSQPVDLTLLDVDGDGDLDAVVADGGTQSIVILAGDGRDVLVDVGSVGLGYRPQGIVSGDLDGIGAPDLVILTREPGGFIVILVDMDVLGAPQSFTACGSGPVAAALGDLDGDGALDLVLVDPPPSQIVILTGDELGGFGAPYALDTGGASTSVAIANLDGDCDLDVAIADSDNDAVRVLYGDGTGGLAEPVPYMLSGAPPRSWSSTTRATWTQTWP